MESLLKKAFDFCSQQNTRFAVHWVEHHQHWYVCPTAIYVQPEKDIEHSLVEAYQGNPVSAKLVENPSLAYPENLFVPLSGALPNTFSNFFMADKCLYSLVSGDTVPITAELPHKHYTITQEMIKDNWDKFDEVQLGMYKGTSMVMMHITAGIEQLWFAPPHEDHPEMLKLNIAGETITPSGWNDTEKCYKNLRKEKKNMPLKNMNDIVKSTLGVDAKDLKFDPEKTGAQNDGTAGTTLKEAVAAQAPVEAPKEAAKEPAKEESVKAPVEESAKEPVKRTRKKAEATPVTDLTKVIEQLSGAVPENLSSEDALKALRQLRDLQLAASRRAANIAVNYIESTEGAVAKLNAIKAAL